MITKTLIIITVLLNLLPIESTFGQYNSSYECHSSSDMVTEVGVEHEVSPSRIATIDDPIAQSFLEMVDAITDSRSNMQKVSYLLLRRQVVERLEQHGVPYSYSTLDKATSELVAPKPTPIPSNDDVFLRRLALMKVGACDRSSDPFGALQANYKRCLNAITDASPFEESITASFPFKGANGGISKKTAFSYDNQIYESFAWKVSVPTEVKSGAPIPLKLAIENISSKTTSVSDSYEPPAFFYLNSIMIRRVENQEIVMLTAKGIHDYYADYKLTERNHTSKIELQPGESFEAPGSSFDLIENYDLNEPGDYELTFFTRQYCDDYKLPLEDQELEYPRKATVRFTVLPKSEGEESSGE